jgi:hypothetical protein
LFPQTLQHNLSIAPYSNLSLGNRLLRMSAI